MKCKHKTTIILESIKHKYCLDCNQLVNKQVCAHPKKAVKSIGNGFFKCGKCLKVF